MSANHSYRDLVAALRTYEQADIDGVMVNNVSRQALEEAATIIEQLAGPEGEGWIQGKKSHPTQTPATTTSVGDRHLYLYAANGLIYHFPPKEKQSSATEQPEGKA